MHTIFKHANTRLHGGQRSGQTSMFEKKRLSDLPVASGAVILTPLSHCKINEKQLQRFLHIMKYVFI